MELREELKTLPKQARFSTGYRQLDAFMGDLREGDLHIIAGMTGHGKSQMGISLTKNFIARGENVLWFSFEITSQELFERFGLELPVFYLPRITAERSVPYIERKIDEAVERFGTKFVFIDHLHYLISSGMVGKNTSEVLAAMTRRLKLFARSRRLCIFLIAHTRKVQSDQHRPTLDDIKDSSGIAQESDSVLIVNRVGARRQKKKALELDEEVVTNLSSDVDIFVDKNRRTGRLGKVRMRYDTIEAIHKEYD